MMIASKYHDSVNIRPFCKGDTVRGHDNQDNCAVIPVAAGFGSILSTTATPRRSLPEPTTTTSSGGRRSRKAAPFTRC